MTGVGRALRRRHWPYDAIMLRVQAQLTEEQARRLKDLAGAEGVSVGELLRRGADLLLAHGPDDSAEARKHRAVAAVGRFRGDGSAVAEGHDEYLEEAFANGDLR